jgi:predicted membrane-bound spermidine synthase
MSDTALAGWENFYVIVGSSAGALIGLQFVVMTLIAERLNPSPETTDAFATPSVIHFAAVLLLSALLSAPWSGIVVVALLWGLVGLGGIVYTIVVARRLRKQTQYKPVFEDWLCHVHLPFAAYAILVGSAFAARTYSRAALFCTGASALLLLFVGIHNAWDAATYVIAQGHRGSNGNE